MLVRDQNINYIAFRTIFISLTIINAIEVVNPQQILPILKILDE